MNKLDINITEISKKDSSKLKQSQLVLQFNGESVNSSIINSLRRTIQLYIPTYAACRASIEIYQNTSVMNNDYMKLRLEQITCPNIKNNIVILPEMYWKNVNYASNSRPIHPDDKTDLEYTLNVTNNTKETLNVTTNDITLYLNGEKVKLFDQEYPLLLIQLKEGQSFKCRSKYVLGLGINNDIWSAASNVFYDEISSNKYHFTIESQGQMDEYEMLKKACVIILDKIKNIKLFVDNSFSKKDYDSTNKITLNIYNEDISICHIINETLQNNKNIQFSGISRPYSFDSSTFIKIVSVNNNPLTYIYESIDYLIELYTILNDKVTKLGKKYINYDY